MATTVYKHQQSSDEGETNAPTIESPLTQSRSSKPYPFKPYNLTPLDHTLPPCHLFMFFTLKNSGSKGIDALKTGVSRLNAHLPFLTGVMAPSSQAGGKQNVYEVQPASASYLEKHPMLQIEHHPELARLPPNDLLNEKFLPLPFFMPFTEPLPLLRLKANVTKDTITLCLAHLHKAIDGGAVSVILRALAELCKDPNAPLDALPTSPEKEEAARQYMEDFTAKEPGRPSYDLVPLPLDAPLPQEPGLMSISRRYKFSAEKITLLKDACNAVIADAKLIVNPSKPIQLTTNDIITAIIGLCGNRARMLAIPGRKSPPRLIMVANIRKLISLPENYAANALAAIPADYNASWLPDGVAPQGLPATLMKEDVIHLCNLAFSLRKGLNAMTKPYIKGVFTTFYDANDWLALGPNYDSIIVSNLRWMDFFIDFGPLGKVQEYDVPETKIGGISWVLPARNQTGKGLQPFEMRCVLERVAMDQMEKDSLFQWISSE
ncbi:hypothetical protein AJ79_01089 [Helicocarpus griseus UAMH5409]|uniref:O-acetyltransferase n=1 Tax=Helicocarpus griseus UAMH5409 TaxID=1447875 RepID=A0A2B7Y8R6_9EURO|nr:hypothetical protein AJ79_01089 [Helicocarpus griseus UAMH5409]